MRGDDFGEALGRQIRLLHYRCRARIHQGLRVRRLMVINGVGERHKQRGDAHGRHFGHRQRAGAGNNPVGSSIGRRHVFNKRHNFGGNTSACISGARFIEPALADLMHHLRALIFW